MKKRKAVAYCAVTFGPVFLLKLKAKAKTMKHFLLEILSAIIGLLVWWLGWPILREINLALNIIGAIIAIGGLVFIIILAILIIQSQLEPPYAKKI
jgi:hypothetical protein